MSAETYFDYGVRAAKRLHAMLQLEGHGELPSTYAKFLDLDEELRRKIALQNPLVLSDNYEHFMATLRVKEFAAQHVLVRKQIGGFTVAAGFWKWLECLSHPLTEGKVDLTADFFSGAHNNYPRQFDKGYWQHVVRDYGGYMPLQIWTVGEGAVFTGVPFPIAQVYGETPAVWLNEPLYIQTGHLTHVATVAAQFAEALGDPWRFIEVMFRALHNAEESPDVLLAMLIGGGIISTSNDMGAFINGSPFKSSGTMGHCWGQQFETLLDGLRMLLTSPQGKFATVLLDHYDHKHGFAELMKLIEAEGLPAPFAERPDSGDTLALGTHDLLVLEDAGHEVKVVFEDGYRALDVQRAERNRRQHAFAADRVLYGGGSAFIGQRRLLETAYKAAHYHNGTFKNPNEVLDTMKICLTDPMKQSLPGLVEPFFNAEQGVYMVGTADEQSPRGYAPGYELLYDNLTNPGHPYFNPNYDPRRLVTSSAITQGIERSKKTRALLGPVFTQNIGENREPIGMTKALRQKRDRIYQRALETVKA